MDLESLTDELEAILPDGFHIDTDNNGQIVIYTGLMEDGDGDLVEFVEDDYDDESDEDSDYDLEDSDDEEEDEDEDD